MARKSVDDKLRVYMQQMGRVPDQVIAREAEVSRAVVVSFRQRNGIPAYDGHRHRSDADTDTGNSGEIGESSPPPATPPPAAAVSVSASEAPVRALLTEPPVSQAPGGDAVAVGDGSAAGQMEDAPNFKGRRSALDAYQHLLGHIPDARLAEMANVTPENVRSYRTRRGISADWNREEEPAEPERAPPEPLDAAPTLPAPRVAFQVLIALGGHPSAPHRYVVMGRDIVDAAQTAVDGIRRRHPQAEVRAVERVAELLDGEAG